MRTHPQLPVLVQGLHDAGADRAGDTHHGNHGPAREPCEEKRGANRDHDGAGEVAEAEPAQLEVADVGVVERVAQRGERGHL